MPDPRSEAVVDALMADLRQLSQLIEDRGPTPFLLRVYARTIFSVFDGYAYYLKQKAARRAEAEGLTVTRAELEMIYERRGDNPRHGGKPKTVSTADNLRFALKLWARVNGGESPPRDAQLPPEFEQVRILRNAITHPKTVEDFNVTAEDARAMARLFSWFSEITQWNTCLELAYIDSVERRIQTRNEELRRQIVAAGPVDESRRMTVEEMYTPPRLKKPE